MHSDNKLQLTEDELLFINRPDWKIKKELREVSTIKQIMFYFTYFRYLYKIRVFEFQLQSLRQRLDQNNLSFMEKRLKKLENKNIVDMKKYITKTKKILNIK